MKKIFTLLAFAFIFTLGTQSIVAQNKIEIHRVAAEKTQALYKAIKFSTDQREQVFEAIKDYEFDMVKFKATTNTDEESEKKIKDRLEVRMKEILNEAQYDNYRSLEENS